MFDNIIPRIWIISHEIRQKILKISYSDWEKLGLSKGGSELYEAKRQK